MTPLISFTGNGNYIPTTKVYTKSVKTFIKMFPQVRYYTPWNEPDWVYRPKLANNPKLAASYYNALVKACHRCTVAAGDVYRAANQGLAKWVRSYARYLHGRPKAWALHPYNDVRTHTTSQLRAFMSVTRGPIWFDEISGVLRRGHWQYQNQSAAAAGRDEKFLFSLPKRFHRIARIYHYQWLGTVPAPNNGWDSGLLNPNGTTRPAYTWVDNAAHGSFRENRGRRAWQRRRRPWRPLGARRPRGEPDRQGRRRRLGRRRRPDGRPRRRRGRCAANRPG